MNLIILGDLYSQKDSTFSTYSYTVEIDSIVNIINQSNSKPIIIEDSGLTEINGDRIVKIELTIDSTIRKYKLLTSNKGHYMNVKSINIFEFKGEIINAIQYYSEDQHFWVSYYYKQNELIYILGFPRGIRFPQEEDKIDFKLIIEKLKPTITRTIKLSQGN